jgi:nucleotide-binding universal stress UspA family protein
VAKLIVAVDFSEAFDAVLREAAKWALNLSAELWLVHVADPDPAFVGYAAGPQTVRDEIARRFRHEHRRLQVEAARLRDRGIVATPLLVQGPVGRTLAQQAVQLDADMIIVGSHGHGALHDLLVGSVSEEILRASACPVLVVPTRRKDRPHGC